MALEEEFDTEIPDEEAEKITTGKSCCNHGVHSAMIQEAREMSRRKQITKYLLISVQAAIDYVNCHAE